MNYGVPYRPYDEINGYGSMPNPSGFGVMPSMDASFSSIGGYGPNTPSSAWQPGWGGPNEIGGNAGIGVNPNQFKFGMNIPSFMVGLQGLQTLSNIYNGFTMAGIAKDQLAYTKKIGDANLTNQIKSYNTNLTSNATADAKVGGWTPEQTQAYIDSNQLPAARKG